MLRGATAGASGPAAAALIGCADDDGEETPGNGGAGTPAGGATTAPGAASTPGPASGDVTRGGAFRASGNGVIAGVDPHNSVYYGQRVVRTAYNYLFRKSVLEPQLGFAWDLAESMEQPDDNTYVFTLRQNATIGPNDRDVPERPLDAEDVVASLARVADPEAGSNGFAEFNTWVEAVEHTDQWRVTVRTKQPYAWMLDVLGDNLIGAIVPREWLESDDLKPWAVGAGPWALERIQEGEGFTMKPNPNYWEEGVPYVDTYQALVFPDPASERTAFVSDQTDIYEANDIEEARQLEQEMSGVTRVESLSTGFNSFWMNVNTPPWDDDRVRRALNMSIDREQYVQIIGKGQGEPIGVLSTVFDDYALSGEELAEVQPFDPEEAKSLFEAAGVSEVRFTHPTSGGMPDYVNILVTQLRNIGITAGPEALDAGTWVAQYFQSALAASYSLNQRYQTPDKALQWYHTGGITGNNHYDTGFSDPEVDAAIEEAAATLDEEARKQAYLDAQRLIFEKAPPFLNIFGVYLNVVYRNRVQNLHIGKAGAGMWDHFLKYVWLDA